MLLALLISIALQGAPAAKPDQTAAPFDVVQGTWVPVSAELGGMALPPETLTPIKLVIKGNTYSVALQPGQTDQGTLKLDAKTSPKNVDIFGTDGPNKDKTYLAIYEREGDTLKLCYDFSGVTRPKEFKSPQGSQLFYVVYKLQK